jgi:hypothetical protein
MLSDIIQVVSGWNLEQLLKLFPHFSAKFNEIIGFLTNQYQLSLKLWIRGKK